MGRNPERLSMLEILASDAGVVAIRVDGKLDHDAVEYAKAFFEKRFAVDEKVHLYVEVENFTGFDIKELPGYLAGSASFLPKLDHLGRVAIVSDAAWIRWASKFESAILPHAHYETFVAAERDQARAWVDGRAPLPHRNATSIIETNSPNVIGFCIEGKPGAAELKALTARFDEALRANPPLRALARLKRLDGAAIGGILDKNLIDVKRRSLAGVERFAIVGGPQWLGPWVSILDSAFKIEIRHFALTDEASAWTWLGAEPVSERALMTP